MKRWPTKPLGEVCAINPKLVASEIPGTNTDVTFVPMAAVDELSGSIARPKPRKYSQVAKGYTPFRENDVLFAKITPCMQNGKAAIARGLRGGLGFGSTEFHVLRPTEGLLPQWVFAFIRQPSFRSAAEANFTGTAGQQRVPVDFLKNFPIPVPPLPEQGRLVKLLDEADELRKLRGQADRRTAVLIPALFHEMFGNSRSKGWPSVRLGEVAPIVRRPVQVDLLANYPELGIRSFGKGTFHKPSLSGVEVGGKRIYRIEPGDLLFSNVFAWEGAIAVVKREDSGRFGSHRFIACVPKAEVATSDFLSFYFLTAEGLEKIGEASPGGAGRNRTLGLDALSRINVPLPPLPLQKEFAQRGIDIRELETAQAARRQRSDDLFQSLLHRAFEGEL